MDQNNQYGQMNNQMNSSPIGSPQPAPNPSEQQMTNGSKKVGPIITTLVIVLVLIIAALYLFASRINQQAIPTDSTSVSDTTGTAGTAAAATPTVQPVSNTGNDPASLQSDLNASLKGVDSQNF